MSKFIAAIHAPYTPADLWAERLATLATFGVFAAIASLLLSTIAV